MKMKGPNVCNNAACSHLVLLILFKEKQILMCSICDKPALKIKVILDDYTLSVSLYVSTLSFLADRPGPAAILHELLLYVRQPHVLTNHGHEHGEQWTHLADSGRCISVLL